MENNKQLGQIKNLIMLALADGTADEKELALIAAVASREKLTEEQVNQLIENPGTVHVELPEDEESKKRYLTDMVVLMMADGVMDDDEIAMCKLYAITLGFDSSMVESLVIDLAELFKQ